MATGDKWLPTRRSLISRLKDWDDQEGWREFFETYSRLLYSVAVKAGFNDTAAQDIVQDTIITVARHIPGFKYDPARGSFKGWLLNIARSRIIDHVRKRQRQPARAEPHAEDTSQTAFIDRVPDTSPAKIDQLWDEEWQKHLFDAAVQRVKEKSGPKDFQIFECHVLKQWPVKQVAASLRVSEAQVYVAKSRVAALLKKEVEHLETEFR